MLTAKCPTCAGAVDDTAQVCPHCGRSLIVRAFQPTPSDPPLVTKVSVVDVDMPFGSLVWMLIKWTLAAIPALLILAFATALVAGVFTALTTALLQ